jgi:nitrite reductase (NADH) small subunit
VPASDLVPVSSLAELPVGALRQVSVDGVDVALANVRGEVHAFQGRCPHMKGPLGRGELEDCVVTCPFHGWQFDVTTGRNQFDRAITIDRYEVAVEDGEIRVALPRE